MIAFLPFIIVLLAVIFISTRDETFKIWSRRMPTRTFRHQMLPVQRPARQSQLQSRRPVQRQSLRQSQWQGHRTPIQQIFQQPIRPQLQVQQPQLQTQMLQPQQGLPLGPALANPYGTGIVQGSSIAPLQQQYRQIFSPRPNHLMSGQQQRQQHLQPGGLGRSGWIYRRP